MKHKNKQVKSEILKHFDMPSGSQVQDDKAPLVSVVMPVYNASQYLEQSIESVLNQSYENWELVIVDDGSSDESLKFLRKFARKDARIKVYENRQNQGIGKTMNRLLELAAGELIARMDADDVMYPDRLEKQVNYLTEHPEVGVVGGFMVEINSDNEIVAARKVPLDHQHIAKNMYLSQTIQNPTLMIHASRLPKSQLWYDGSFSPVDDLDFLFRMLPYTTFANIPEYLMAYRRHESNSSLRNIKKTFRLTKQVRQKAVDEYGYQTSLKKHLLHAIQSMLVKLVPQGFLYSLFKLWKRDKVRSHNWQIPTLAVTKRRDFSISLVVPVYKGEEYILDNLTRLLEFMRKQRREFEVVVVVDGQLDRTEDIASKMARHNPELTVLSYKKNMGKGYAVRYGLVQASGDYIGYLDSGKDIDYYSISLMLKSINDDPEIDVIIGDKRHALSLIQEIPMKRRIYSILFRSYVNFMLQESFRDTQVGLKLFKRSVVQSAIQRLPYGINRFAFDVELMKVLKDGGCRLHSSPIVINQEIRKSTVTWWSIMQMILDVERLAVYYLSRRVADRRFNQGTNLERFKSLVRLE